MRTGVTFGNDQYAQAKISTIAPFTSVVSITAASQSGSNTTYRYTLTSGAELIVPQVIYISGMADVGNNGSNFITTALGNGTFTVANPSGVTRSGQSGTGISPSDSVCGLVVRGKPDGLNAYVFVARTNSYSGQGRVYTREIWKYVNGKGTILAFATQTSIPDSSGDVYIFSAIGITLTAYKNGTSVLTTTDSSLTSGFPGIWTWSLSGPQEFDFVNWANPGIMGSPLGNNGTHWSSFQAGDMSITVPSPLSESVASTNGDLHAVNPD